MQEGSPNPASRLLERKDNRQDDGITPTAITCLGMNGHTFSHSQAGVMQCTVALSLERLFLRAIQSFEPEGQEEFHQLPESIQFGQMQSS